MYAGDGQYVVETIGHTDDTADADGVHVLDFWQAQDKARAMQGERGDVQLRRYTLRQTIADYVEHMDGRATQQQTVERLAAYVPAALADKDLTKITTDDLAAWHRAMARSLPRVRTSEAEPQNHRHVDLDDAEVLRRRKVSANRVLAQLRAALNFAFRASKVPSDAAWKRVRPFRGVASARVRYLTVAECKRLLNACDGDFRSLVRAALETGCRYQELARLKVEDFNPDVGTLLIRTSKTGKSRHVILTDEGQSFFSQLTLGRVGSELMMGKTWRQSETQRPMLRACARATIDPPISFHGLRHTWASLAVMGGVPLMVVAKNLGHADTRMVEKHYGHLAPSYIADAIRQHAPRFGFVARNVKAIR
jgi:integrase